MSTFIIAEAGVNHNGSLEKAKDLVRVAAHAKADAVKFQTFNASQLVTKWAKRAEYQERNTKSSESQFEMLKALELSKADHVELIKTCRENAVQFMSSPFDLPSVDLLAGDLNLESIKIPSGEITNAPFLLRIAQYGRQVILSTGMCSYADIEAALGVLAFGFLKNIGQIDGTEPLREESFFKAFASEGGYQCLKKNVVLLHCTSEYPTPFEQVNLRAMKALEQAFQLRVGLSDHTPGISVATAAIGLGASVIEKHFTLDKSLPGPDHKASLDPAELTALVQAAREVEAALGNGRKVPVGSELKTRLSSRKSLVARTSIRIGECFSEDNLTVKRPGTGISPMHYWDRLGQVATRALAPDDVI